MKKIIASASLTVLGAASLQAAYAPGLSPQERSKIWTISAALRGFYDDNYTTSYKTAERDSFGVEIIPSIGFNFVLDQTVIGFSYEYGLRYYEDRDDHSTDQSHVIEFKLNHAFNERFRLEVGDSFAIAQEPEVLDSSGVITSPLRSEGDNMRNRAYLNLDADLTETLSLEFSFSNSIYNYDQEGNGSRSAILDRVENLPALTLTWQATQTTAGLLGYQYGMTSYTGDDSLDQFTDPGPPPFGAPYVDPEVRNANSHYLFAGVNHVFTSQLDASLRAGVQVTDYPDAMAGVDDSTTSPYVDFSSTWKYNPGSYMQFGVRHSRNPTDIAFTFSSTPTMDQESTSAYLTLNHRITPKVTGSLLGQYQHSEFNGGNVDGEADNFFIAGVNLSYQVNTFISAEAGYNFDRLDSDIPNRSYSRNRIYLGVRATY